MKFSVLMSIYKNDKKEYVKEAIYSVINQTVAPSEIVIVIDGPISEELRKEINCFKLNYKFIKIISLDVNVGLGRALQLGLENCSYELVARMDSDDISIAKRFETQIKILKKYKDVSVVGSYISEFIGEKDNIIGVRNVPLEDKEIKKYIKKRCPFNHMTVMLKKKDVIKSGGYKHWHYNEDYYLWIRMMQNGCKFANIDKSLVNVRVGEEMYKRRGGKDYYKSEKELQKYMLNNKIINKYTYLQNIFIRFLVQKILPNNIRGFLYRKIFRSS